MIISQDAFNKEFMTSEYIFKSEVLGGDVRVRDLSILEYDEFRRLFEENQLLAVFYAASRVCVEPKLPENAIEQGKQNLMSFVNEIIANMPYFGMSEEEKEEAIKKQEEFLKNNNEEEADSGKKPERKGTSS